MPSVPQSISCGDVFNGQHLFGGNLAIAELPASLNSDTRRQMTAIDFAAFVDELASVSGETIRPFFRTALGIENKSSAGGFDPVTAADRASGASVQQYAAAGTVVAIDPSGQVWVDFWHQSTATA